MKSTDAINHQGLRRLKHEIRPANMQTSCSVLRGIRNQSLASLGSCCAESGINNPESSQGGHIGDRRGDVPYPAGPRARQTIKATERTDPGPSANRLRQIRLQIIAGTYLTQDKINIAATRLLAELQEGGELCE